VLCCCVFNTQMALLLLYCDRVMFYIKPCFYCSHCVGSRRLARTLPNSSKHELVNDQLHRLSPGRDDHDTRSCHGRQWIWNLHGDDTRGHDHPWLTADRSRHRNGSEIHRRFRDSHWRSLRPACKISFPSHHFKSILIYFWNYPFSYDTRENISFRNHSVKKC